MRIDETHRSWAFGSGIVLALAVIGYIPYRLTYPGGPRGNSLPGLLYGLTGYGMMLYAGLMGARKKVPIWRIGRAKTWMRGHLWMGALSLPMLILHSGFHRGGPLTSVLLALLFLVVLSGITGALIQHVVPKRMMSSVQLETIYEQIPQVREQLREEASALVAEYSEVRQEVVVGELVVSEREGGNLRHVYINEILPFLRDPVATESPLADRGKAAPFFEALRRQSPPAIHDALVSLENICEEERQLTRQQIHYYWLHGWLLVHVPLSITLLVLGGIHAIVGLRY